MNPPLTRPGWIPEVQGLRTLALALVSIYHIWFAKVSGGVDVFLVVSAFLLTRSFVGRAERGEPTRPLAFILRRFALLLPLTALTVVSTIIACTVVFPESLTASHLYQGLASLTYWENIWLQDAEVEYLASGPDSPFQHFWSLSVQGQIFIIWPLLLAGCIWCSHRARASVRRVLTVVFACLAVGGFIYATQAVAANPESAYFSLPARMWEFAAGSFLALVQPYLRLAAPVRISLGWIGVIGLIACGAVLPARADFPSWPALWPVACAAFVIVAAGEPSRFGARAVLCHPWMQQAARYTYALYLTHWPVLVLTRWYWELDSVPLVTGIGVLIVSVALAVVFTEVVDRPISRFVGRPSDDEKPRRTEAAARASRRIIARVTGTVTARAATALCSVLVVATGLVVGSIGVYRADSAAAWAAVDEAPLESIGANRLEDTLIDGQTPFPRQLVVRDDLTRLAACDHDVIATVPPTLARNCLSSRPGQQSERTVFVIGNSQAQQAASLVLPTAEREGWEVRAFIYFACQFDSFERAPHKAQDCDTFWREAREYVLRERPDALLVQVTRSQAPDIEPELPGIWEFIDEVEAAGIEVIAMRDIPRVHENPFACVERHGINDERCVQQTELHRPRPDLAAKAAAHNASYLDVNDVICPDGECRPVRGGVYVFMDASHQSATYMRTIAPIADRRIHEHLTWWPGE